MYKSIIDIITSEPTYEIDGEIFKAVQRYGINVDKEELLKALRYDRDQYNKGYQDGLNADKWIPCSERLPEINTWVMCFTINETYVFGEYGGCDSHYLSNKDVWFTDKGWFKKDCIIAWQPLPEPFKGEQE